MTVTSFWTCAPGLASARRITSTLSGTSTTVEEKPEHEIATQPVASAAHVWLDEPGASGRLTDPADDRRNRIGPERHLCPLAVVVADGQSHRPQSEDRRQQIKKGVLLENRKGDKTVAPGEQLARDRGHRSERTGLVASRGKPTRVQPHERRTSRERGLGV